ncbi:MAG: nitroreductase family protein [Deltaproteobacteria bacterium]|nr:nitroreductase family protein [Candidatus Zymogenaceae bacterium]
MIRIDEKACTACGICGAVCPRHIPEAAFLHGEKVTVVSEERRLLCMECGHCVAVCPRDAIEVQTLNDDDFAPVRDVDIDGEALFLLLKQRRSVRVFTDTPIPREKIDAIINAARVAPTGTGKSSTGLIVIDDPDVLAELSEHAYMMYEKLERLLRNPIARMIVKRRAGKKGFRTLKDFVMPGMHWYIRWYREGKGNEILRGARVLMLFHSPTYEPVGEANCLIAALHAVLMAEAMGIGSCFNDIIPPACNRVPEIRKLLSLSDDREVSAGVILGYPKYKFRKAPPRELSEVRYI